MEKNCVKVVLHISVFEITPFIGKNSQILLGSLSSAVVCLYR